ncbi:4845_t:CDS:2, partial [Paraglomus occultum]
MKQHTGGKPPHRLTPYVEVLSIRVNKSNRAAACKACINKLGRELALERSVFTNTKTCVKAHLKKCPQFAEQHGEEARLEILYGSDEEGQNIDTSSVTHSSTISHNFLSSSSEATTMPHTTDMPPSRPVRHSRNRSLKGPIENYLVRDLNSAEYIIFEQHLLKATVSNGWAFRWIENPEVIALFKFLNPVISLPGRRALAGRILSSHSAELQRKQVVDAKKEEIGNTLAFDGWKNVNHQEILGSVLITSKGKVLVWGAEDISGDGACAIDVVQKIRDFFMRAESNGIKIIAVVTDSASAYAAARRQMRLEYTSIVFLPCFAHQANLCVADIFKSSPQYKIASSGAVTIVAYFTDNRHSSWISKLRQEQKALYGKYYALVRPTQTRWNSYYFCFASLVRSKRALK